MTQFRSILVCLSMLALLAFSPPALADQFYSSSGFTVNPDFNSGSAFGSAFGSNAVPMQLSSTVSYWLNPGSGTAYVDTTVTLTGVWGDPTANNPYYDFLENEGLRTFGHLNFIEVEWNGQWYEFEYPVTINLQAQATISRDDAHTWLDGFFWSNATGIGAVPIMSTSAVQIYEPGHPDFVPDWQIDMTTRWLITSDFQPIPGPGSLALVGLGGMAIIRRRRQH